MSSIRLLTSSILRGLPSTLSLSRLIRSFVSWTTLFNLLFLKSNSCRCWSCLILLGNSVSWLSFTDKWVRLIRSPISSGSSVSMLWLKSNFVRRRWLTPYKFSGKLDRPIWEKSNTPNFWAAFVLSCSKAGFTELRPTQHNKSESNYSIAMPAPEKLQGAWKKNSGLRTFQYLHFFTFTVLWKSNVSLM